jgi:sigma-E factor negative regulatory protein RseA
MKDQLSALMDGEFDTESAEHVITSVKSGGELRSCWTRYHLIGDAMRGEVGRGGVQVSHDFSRRVMHALESEPILLAPNGQNQAQISSKQSSYNTPRFWSVAASVAAVMFVGVMVLQQQLSQPEALAPVEIAQSVPTEYLQAHQAAAPSNAAYYIQTANYTEPKQ